MTRIKPFKAIHYNTHKVGNPSLVMCPPYDVISPAEQSDLHNLSPNNFVWVELPRERPSDDKDDNRYTRAKKVFESWLEKNVLIEDEKPAIYFYKQEYSVMGVKHSRLGFISLLKLENEGESTIHPHENTHAHAVEDRFTLWSTLKANLSSIFVCFSDKQKKVENIFLKHMTTAKPILDVTDPDKVRHVVWRLEDPKLIKEITDSLESQNLFIADGHHRYKVATEIRKEKLSKRNKVTGEEPFNYVMTYFINMDSRDLQIFPIHRVIKKLPKSLDFLEDNFRIDKVKSKEDLLILLAKAGVNEHAFGLYTRDGIRLLRLKNKLLIDQEIKDGSTAFKHLDATILKHFVLDRLGIRSEDIVYTKDLTQATAMVDENQAQASFILNPVRIQQLKEIALNGERMPPKTTYFYPKVLSGLTVHRFDS